MAEILIDMTGKGGLSNNVGGFQDQITTTPNLMFTDNDAQFVSGLFNPYLRNGYLAPVTTTTTSVTATTPVSQFTSVEFDTSASEVILLNDTNKIYKLSSLTDVSADLVETLGETNSFGTFTYDDLYDAQVYTLNGERKLYIVGKSIPYYGQQTTWATTTGTQSIINTFSMNPSGSTQPSILYTERSFTASPGTSQTLSITVPSGTDRCLVVACFFSNTYNPAYIYSYGDSVELTKLGEAGTAGGPGYIASYIVNPATGTYNVQVVGPAGGFTNLTMIAFVTDNTDQTNPVSFQDSRPTSGLLQQILNYTDTNQLGMAAIYSNGVITKEDDLDNLEGATQAYGSDMLIRKDVIENGTGLMVGVLDLPITTATSSYETWLSHKPIGSFYQEITSDFAFMRTSDNGFAYVFADNAVHKIDGGITGGTNGTVTKNVLLFPSNFTITDALDYRSLLYIAVHQYPVTVQTTTLNTFNGKCGLYVWNRISTQLNSADFIELPGVREIKRIFASPEGVVQLIVINDAGLTELRRFGYNDSGGVVFPVVKTLGVGAFPQFPDGLTIASDKVLWLGNDGKLYCEKAGAVTQLFEVKAQGSTTATTLNNIKGGAIFYGSGDETASSGYRSNKQGVIMSYLDTTPYTIKVYPFDLKNGSNSTQTPHIGNVYTGVNYVPVTSVIRQLRIYNAPITGTGTTVIATVKLYFNQSSTVGMTKTITKNEAKRGYVDFHINKSYLHAIQIEVEWATDVVLGEDTYLPSVAVVSHDPTTTKSPENG